MFTEDSPLLTPPSAGLEQIVAFMLARPHGGYTEHDIHDVIVPTYYTLCCDSGLDPTLAIAQMIHETGNLCSFWAARPQRNPAGLGVNGRRQSEQPADIRNWVYNTQRGQWEAGLSFASWRDDAIPAHLGRLLAYVLPLGAENEAHQALIAQALNYRALPDKLRGSAATLKLLGRTHNPSGLGWASPGDLYGAKIAEIANRIVATYV